MRSLIEPLSLNGNLTFVLLSLQEPRCPLASTTSSKHTHSFCGDREIEDLGGILGVFSDYTPNLTANLPVRLDSLRYVKFRFQLVFLVVRVG